MSTVEYVAVVLLVSIVLAFTGATIAGVDVADAVGRKIRVALCIVSGDDCDENGEEEACVVSSESTEHEDSVSVVVYRGKDGRTVLVERLSNGKYRVSVTQTTRVGGGGGLGIGIKLWKWGAGGSVDGAAYATAGYERVFEVDGKTQAERLVERLDDDDWKLAGAAEGAVEMIKGDHAGAAEQSFQVGVGGEAEAALQALGFEPAKAAAAATYTTGIRLDHRTGTRSVTLAQEISGSVDVSLQIANVGVSASAPRSLELRFDRHNRPTALVLHAGLEGAASAHSPLAHLDLSGGGRVQVEAELDLADPALAPYVQQLQGGDVAAVAPLVRQMATGARIKAQAYATTEKKDGWSFSLKAPLGEVGIGKETTERTAKLLGAVEHKPGTPITEWERDCGVTA